MAKLTPLLVALFSVLIGQSAFAIWMRSHSLEWWTSISDTVAVVDVSSAKKLDPLNQYWQSQELRCTPVETLKGERVDSFIFRQDFRENKPDKKVFDAALEPGNRLLLFYARAEGERKAEVLFWVNLTNPDGNLTTHAAYDNNCKLIDNGASAVTLVKARIALENPQAAAKKRGLIISFKTYEPADMYWDFVRTTDPEYKAVLIRQLAGEDEETAIYNLISYPGKETCDLIRPFLTDKKTSAVQNAEVVDEAGNKRHANITIYPLRQAAYTALTLLGETPAKPEGYYPGQEGWLFKVGFESGSYFRHGDWKRLNRK